jgi:hypothetical protein
MAPEANTRSILPTTSPTIINPTPADSPPKTRTGAHRSTKVAGKLKVLPEEPLTPAEALTKKEEPEETHGGTSDDGDVDEDEDEEETDVQVSTTSA